MERPLCPPMDPVSFTLPIEPVFSEDTVWRQRVEAAVADLSRNVGDILYYAFTEMLNNAMEHSGGTVVTVDLERRDGQIHLRIRDDGIGVFRRIREAFSLEDDHHAILELAKGKLTTCPDSHSGQGLFFASRALDRFSITSGGTVFGRARDGRDFCRFDQDVMIGTVVAMRISENATHTLKEVFDTFSDTGSDDYGFMKTHLLVEMSRYGNRDPVSRSEGKRLVARLENFRFVIVDFSGIAWIGQAFADEVFRVFLARHPTVTFHVTGANPDVMRMILGTGWRASAGE